MNMISCFVELCAGRAALSWRLEHNCTPPGGRVGSKTGYATESLAVLGLRPGQRAARYIWAEPDPGARLLLEALDMPQLLMGAAEQIRSWQGADPRVWFEAAHRAMEPLGLSPGSLARYFVLSQWSYRRGFPESGFNTGLHVRREKNDQGGHAANPRTFAQEAGILERAAARTWRHIKVFERAQDVPILRGATVYIDGSYKGTTPYPENLCRDEAIELGRRWAEAGCVVGIAEAEPLSIPGWRSVKLTKRGQARTFSKQQDEFITTNAP